MSRGREICALRFALLASLTAALLVTGPGFAWGANIHVAAGLADQDQVANNGLCTLREAVTAANMNEGDTTDCENGDAGLDTIALPSGTLTLDANGLDEDANANGDLDVDLTAGPVTFDGSDAPPGTTINTAVGLPGDPFNPAQRILHSTADSPNTLTLKDLTLTGGDSRADGVGGGVIVSNNNGLTVDHSAITSNQAVNSGGGIYASGGAGDVTITHSVIRNNQVTDGGAIAEGGGIKAVGRMTVTKSVIDNNTTTSTSVDPGDVANGGGIANDFVSSDEELVIRDSSIVNNAVQIETGAAIAQGGGVDSRSPVEITNSTFSTNSAGSVNSEARGGGLAINSPAGTGAASTIFHTTFALNNTSGTPGIGESLAAAEDVSISAGGNIFASQNFVETCEQFSPNDDFALAVDAGGNLDDGTSCDLVSAADESQNPDLGGLAAAGFAMLANDQAGPPGAREELPVQLPLVGSPAIDHVTFPTDCLDAGTPASVLDTDQRGFPRPVDGDEDAVADCDAGAVEVEPPPDTPPVGVTPVGVAPPVTSTQPTGLRAAALKKCAKIKKNKRKKKKCKRRARRLPV